MNKDVRKATRNSANLIARHFVGWSDEFYRKNNRFPDAHTIALKAYPLTNGNGVYRITIDIASIKKRRVNLYPRKYSHYKHPSMTTARGTLRLSNSMQPIGNTDNDPEITFALACFKGGIHIDENLTEDDVVLSYNSNGYYRIVKELLELGAFHATIIPGPEGTIGRLVIYVSSRWTRFPPEMKDSLLKEVYKTSARTTSEFGIRLKNNIGIRTILGSKH